MDIKCKFCGLRDGIHLLGCPLYVPPEKRKPKDEQPELPFSEMFGDLFGKGYNPGKKWK